MASDIIYLGGFNSEVRRSVKLWYVPYYLLLFPSPIISIISIILGFSLKINERGSVDNIGQANVLQTQPYPYK